MDIGNGNKVVWIVTVNFWTGEIHDVKVKIVKSFVVIGNIHNGNDTVDVSLYPSKSDYEECRYDKKKIIKTIKNNFRYERDVLHSIYVTKLK